MRPPPRDGEPPRPWKSSSTTPSSRRLGGEPLLRVVERPLARPRSPCPCRSPVADHDVCRLACERSVRDVRLARVELGHRRGRLLQRRARLEQRHQRSDVARAALGQPVRREHVGRALGHRDHERRHGLRPIGLRAQRHRVQHPQQLARLAARIVLDAAPAADQRLGQQRLAPRLVGVGEPGQQRAVASRTTCAPWRMSIPARWKPNTSTCHSSLRIAPRPTWREFRWASTSSRSRRSAWASA